MFRKLKDKLEDKLAEIEAEANKSKKSQKSSRYRYDSPERTEEPRRHRESSRRHGESSREHRGESSRHKESSRSHREDRKGSSRHERSSRSHRDDRESSRRHGHSSREYEEPPPHTESSRRHYDELEPPRKHEDDISRAQRREKDAARTKHRETARGNLREQDWPAQAPFSDNEKPLPPVPINKAADPNDPGARPIRNCTAVKCTHAEDEERAKDLENRIDNATSNLERAQLSKLYAQARAQMCTGKHGVIEYSKWDQEQYDNDPRKDKGKGSAAPAVPPKVPLTPPSHVPQMLPPDPRYVPAQGGGYMFDPAAAEVDYDGDDADVSPFSVSPLSEDDGIPEDVRNAKAYYGQVRGWNC